MFFFHILALYVYFKPKGSRAWNSCCRVVQSLSWSVSSLPHGLQHPKLLSLSPGVCSDSCPLSGWFHWTISSSAAPFSFCLHSFPASGSFPKSQFFASGGQIIGTSASATDFPMNVRGWFTLGLNGVILLKSRGLSRVFASTTIRKYQFSSAQPSLWSNYTEYRRRQWQLTPVLLPGKSHGRRSLVGCSPPGRQESDTTEPLHFHFSLSCIGEGNGNPLECSCLENPRDGGAWWAAVSGVARSRTRLKRLGSCSSGTLNTGTTRTPWMVWPPGGDVDQQIETTSMHGPLSTVRFGRLVKPTPVFLPGESQGRGSLVGCRLWGRTESDTTEVT